jgi:hypothetical protein
MKKILYMLVLSACGLLLSVIAYGDSRIKYNYGDLHFVVDSELDAYDVDGGNGVGVGGSALLSETSYITADYETLNYDYETLNYDDEIDVNILQVGVGLIFPARQLDMIAELALVTADTDAPNGDLNTGFRVSSGAHAYVIKNLELRGTLNYIDVDEGDSYVSIAANYFLMRNVSVNLSKDIDADIDRLSIGIRYYIGG